MLRGPIEPGQLKAPSEIYVYLERRQFAAFDAEERMTTIEDPMAYIDSNDPETIRRYNSINAAAKAFYDIILQECPQSAERTLAIRKLQEARMWANAAIAFDGKTYAL